MVQAGAGSSLAAHLPSYPGLDGCPGRFIPVYPSVFIERFPCDVHNIFCVSVKMFALSRVGAPGCFIVGLFAFYLLLGDWGVCGF